MVCKYDNKKRADYLEELLVSGVSIGSFISKNMSSDEWYEAMLILSRRAREKKRLLSITDGIVRSIEPSLKKENDSNIIIGVGDAGLKVLNVLRTKGICEDKLLAINADPDFPKRCSISNKISISGGKVKFISYREDGALIPLSWDGVHHGGTSFYRLLALGYGKVIATKLNGIKEAIIAFGLGGATGTGVAPIIAGIARSLGIKTMVFTHTPFSFEQIWGERMRVAEEGRDFLQEIVGTLNVFAADDVKKDKSTTFRQAFKLLDELLAEKILERKRNHLSQRVTS